MQTIRQNEKSGPHANVGRHASPALQEYHPLPSEATPTPPTYRRPPMLVVGSTFQTCAEPDCYVRSLLCCEYHPTHAYCARHWAEHRMSCRGKS